MLADHLRRSADLLNLTATTLSPERMQRAIDLTVDALRADRPVLVCGNGGSAADAMHITGELVGRFRKERRAFRAICLSADPAVLTAWSNDRSYATVFARQVEAYAQPGGVLVALSTSGRSPSVLAALEAARSRDLATIGLTGEGGGRMAPLCDVLLEVPSADVALIQQVHSCLYHYYCEAIESALTQ